jgi:hypothetical protein
VARPMPAPAAVSNATLPRNRSVISVPQLWFLIPGQV